MASGTTYLRALAESDPACKAKLEQALNLATSFFNPNRKDCVVLPYYTAHDTSHFQHVERFLESIIYGPDGKAIDGRKTGEAFAPTPLEATFLVSAAWLHDLGMLYGIFSGEDPSDLANDSQKVDLARDNHETRTSDFLLNHWKLSSDAWSFDEKTILAEICYYHRARHSFDKFRVYDRSDPFMFRPKAIAALVRLADACHVDESRAPGSLRALYDSQGMPAISVCHWEKAELVSDVQFDHEARDIILFARCPEPHQFALGQFDLEDIIKLVRADLQRELESVKPVLRQFSNVAFREVLAQTEIMAGLNVQAAKRCLAVWPYLLHKPTSATEAAAALAQMVLFACEKSRTYTKALRDRTLDMIKQTLRDRPGDILIRTMLHDITAIQSDVPDDVKSVEPLAQYARNLLLELKQSANEMALYASKQIDPRSALLIYGHSTNINRYLQEVRNGHKGAIYIVDCYQRPDRAAHLFQHESERMIEEVQELGFSRVYLAQFPTLASILQNLKQREISATVLIGTHGVLKSGDLLCKVGSSVLLAAAKQLGAKTIAFAAHNKRLQGDQADEDATILKDLGLDSCETGFGRASSRVLVPQPIMDIVPKEMVDLIIEPSPTLKAGR